MDIDTESHALVGTTVPLLVVDGTATPEIEIPDESQVVAADPLVEPSHVDLEGLTAPTVEMDSGPSSGSAIGQEMVETGLSAQPLLTSAPDPILEDPVEPAPVLPLMEAAQDSESDESTSDASNTTDEIPVWVTYEEDTSVPDEEEMKQIEDSEPDKTSASNIHAMEQQFYTDVEDSEQRPIKKLRLSWVIKDVRGTKERPNYTRVMNSPGAQADGFYWSIKFYPRGDHCSSLSAFVRCSREPPTVDEECPESDFRYWEGSPDADFSGDVEPTQQIHVSARDRPKFDSKKVKEQRPGPEGSKKQTEVFESEEIMHSSPAIVRETSDTSADKDEVQNVSNWRLSAQLGMVIYNPAEPRTKHCQSDGHQFSTHCDDWGWVNFVGPWDEIHKRKRGQRQPLLRNNTLAIDAYIRIYDDPTEALWWHESKDESQWPSKELAGYFSMGTPGLYHSPAVAGITAWMLLAPFRELLQSADGSGWRTDSKLHPKPLICQSQLVLDQMRNLSSDCYVNLYKIIEEFLEVDEQWNDVKSFWEVFRRGLDLEFVNNANALAKLSSIFDTESGRWNMPLLPVDRSPNIQAILADYLDEKKFNGTLPNFMPVMLNRSEFDATTREWKVLHNRVQMSDQLDLSKWSTDSDSKFTLYGFVAHVGVRNSGKFYSVLRPGGIGTKWLAFEDGNGNKVFSYSRKRIQEFEGLEGEELRKLPVTQTRENAYLAMYIRDSCIKAYLPGGLEPYKVSKWLKPWADSPPEEDDDESQVHQEIAAPSSSEAAKQDESGIQIELYLDECVGGCENLLQLHDLRMSEAAQAICRTITVATDKTFKQLRSAVAKAFEIEQGYSKLQMREIHYQGLGKFSRAILEPISYRRKIVREAVPGQIFRIWLSVQQTVGETASYKHFVDRLCNLDLAKKDVEEDHMMEDIDLERLTAMTSAASQEPISDPPQVEVIPSVSGPDEEQESVAAAVEADIEHVHTSGEISSTGIDVIITPASTEQGESSETEDGMMTPTSSTRSVPTPADVAVSDQHALPETESNVDPVAQGDAARPVVHGHLIDAAQHADVDEVVMIVHSSVNVPHGDAAALEQVLSDGPSTDTALVEQVERESQNRTPTPLHVPRTYGNLQVFDADEQKFIAQRPFHPEFEMEIEAAVRKHMGYDEHRQFKVWRRQGATGTERLLPNITFASAGLQDVFTLIVGDYFSEVKADELKCAGKFWKPQQLIRFLGMLNRQHPYLALTSAQQVELAEFGDDYYKGPLSRGRPHGEHGRLITPTGHAYTGPFVAGQKSGSNGKMTYQNGDTYVGAWLNDERHGHGEYVEKRTGNRYVGGFENGKRWGQGTTYWQVADQQADMCQICYEEEIDALFYDCGHVCACVTCAKQCDTCPICRKGVRQVVRMYRA